MRSAIVIVVALVVGLVGPGVADGATFVVNLLTDPGPAGSTGGCASTPEPPNSCSLRQAAVAANADAVADVIQLPSGTMTRDSSLGLVFLNHPTTVAGQGARASIIDATPSTAMRTPGLQVANAGVVELRDLTIRGAHNQIFGGGVAASNSTLTLRRVTIRDNVSEPVDFGVPPEFGGSGGGVSSVAGSLTVLDSTISGNKTPPDGTTREGEGGGLSADTPVTIVNSTISNNSAGDATGGGSGGGIEMSGATATLTMTNVTLAQNTASAGTGTTGAGAGNLEMAAGAATLKNAIVTGGAGAAGKQDCSGPVTSQGGNVGTAMGCVFGGADRVADPGLGPLQDNGGPTDTHSIAQSSLAFDFGGQCAAEVPDDQRGITRPQFNACDSGAFELAPSPPSGGGGDGGGGGGGGGAGGASSSSGAQAGGGVTLAPGAVAPRCSASLSGNAGALRLAISCDQAATATVSGTASIAVKAKLAAAARRKRKAKPKVKRVALPSKTVTLSPGQPASLALALPRSVVAAVKQHAKVSLAVTASVTTAAGATASTTASLGRLKPAKTKHKRHRRR